MYLVVRDLGGGAQSASAACWRTIREAGAASESACIQPVF
jgi:hypothetical protein